MRSSTEALNLNKQPFELPTLLRRQETEQPQRLPEPNDNPPHVPGSTTYTPTPDLVTRPGQEPGTRPPTPSHPSPQSPRARI